MGYIEIYLNVIATLSSKTLDSILSRAYFPFQLSIARLILAIFHVRICIGAWSIISNG